MKRKGLTKILAFALSACMVAGTIIIPDMGVRAYAAEPGQEEEQEEVIIEETDSEDETSEMTEGGEVSEGENQDLPEIENETPEAGTEEEELTEETISDEVLLASYTEDDIEQTGECGEKATYIFYKDGTLVINGEGAISEKAFESKNSGITNKGFTIKKLIINEGIDVIGNSAFAYCYNLQGELVLPESCREIGTYAFGNCVNITKVVFPKLMTSIGTGGSQFYGCASLKEIVWPEHVEYIPRYLFRNCSSLEKIVIPEGVIEIGSGSFRGCVSVKEVVLPSTLKKIANGSGGVVGDSMYYPYAAGVYEEVNGAFACCYSLERVAFNNGSNLEDIGSDAFNSCHELKYFDFPESLKIVRNRAFKSCALSGDFILDMNKTFFEPDSLRNNFFDSITVKTGWTDSEEYWPTEIRGNVKVPSGRSISSIFGNRMAPKVIIEDTNIKGPIISDLYREADEYKKIHIEEIIFPNGLDLIDQKEMFNHCDIERISINGGAYDVHNNYAFAQDCSVGELRIEKDFDLVVPAYEYDPSSNHEEIIWDEDHKHIVYEKFDLQKENEHFPKALTKFSNAGKNTLRAKIGKVIYSKDTTKTVPGFMMSEYHNIYEEYYGEIAPQIVFEGDIKRISTETLDHVSTYRFKIPESVEEHGHYPFYNGYIVYLILPNNMEIMEEDYFRGVVPKNIWIPKTVKEIEQFSFMRLGTASEMEKVYYEGTKDEWEQIKISEERNERLLEAIENGRIVYNCKEEDVLSDSAEDTTYHKHSCEYITDCEYHTEQCKNCGIITGQKEKHTFEPSGDYTHKCTVCGYEEEHVVDVSKAKAIYDESGTDSTGHEVFCEICKKEYKTAHNSVGPCICGLYGHSINEPEAYYVFNKNTQRLYLKGNGLCYIQEWGDYICQNVKYMIVEGKSKGFTGDDRDRYGVYSRYPMPKLEYVLGLGLRELEKPRLYLLDCASLKCVVFNNSNMQNLRISSCPIMYSAYRGLQMEAGDSYTMTIISNGFYDDGLYYNELPLVLVNENFDGFNIVFDANGGSASFDSKTLSTLKMYGELPEAYRKGYTFKGWFTAPEGGVEVTAESQIAGEGLYLSDDNRVSAKVYAQWESKNLPDGFWAEGIEEAYTYTGKAITPELTVSYKDTVLVKGKDYTVSYKNNVKVATADMKDAKGKDIAPVVIITGKGNYSGSIRKNFAITKADLGDAEVVDVTVAYTGKAIKINPVVKMGERTLKLGTDYSIADADGAEVTTYTEPGTYNLKIKGKDTGSYFNEKAFTFTITEKILASKVIVSKIASQPYDGTKKTPAVTLTYNQKDVTDAFIVSYGDETDNISIGNGIVTITATGDTGVAGYAFAGSKTVNFQITGTSIKSAKLENPIAPQIYSNEAKEPEFAVKLGTKVLTKDTDYVISKWENNVNTGTATVVIKGIGYYNGETKFTFKILPYDALKDESEGIVVNEGNPVKATYGKGGAKPGIKISYKGEVLTEKKDYVLSYANFTKVAAADEKNAKGKDVAPTITITFKGNYSGKKAVKYEIVPQDIAVCRVELADVAYSPKTDAWKKTKVKVTDINGKALSAGTDFDKTLEFFKDGEYKYVLKKDVLESGTVVYVKIKGSGNYEGEVRGKYYVATTNISKAKFVGFNTTYEYDGTVIRPKAEELTITYGKDVVLKPGVDYEIVQDSYRNNVNKGKGSFVIRGCGEYYGTKTINFKVDQKKMSIWEWIGNVFS